MNYHQRPKKQTTAMTTVVRSKRELAHPPSAVRVLAQSLAKRELAHPLAQ